MAINLHRRQQVFAVGMWIASLVFAGFLIGLGGLVLRDLPRVDRSVRIDAFVDAQALAALKKDEDALAAQQSTLDAQLTVTIAAQGAAQNAYRAEKERFDNWIAARTATTDPAQDPEVLARTRTLDTLKAAEEAADKAVAQDRGRLDAADRSRAAHDARRASLFAAARPAFERAEFFREARVFAWRLALTLPLLVFAGWLLMRPKGDYWPLTRGFVLFAVYVFFIELVPWLPDYGFYVRFGVGIVLVAVLVHFAARWMRAQSALRAEAASLAVIATPGKAEAGNPGDTAAAVASPTRVTLPPKARAPAGSYDDHLKNLASQSCPSCARPFVTTKAEPADFCAHCGIRLFDNCTQCESRKFAFLHFCVKCGTPASGAIVP